MKILYLSQIVVLRLKNNSLLRFGPLEIQTVPVSFVALFKTVDPNAIIRGRLNDLPDIKCVFI
jgi:hypothetical protein